MDEIFGDIRGLIPLPDWALWVGGAALLWWLWTQKGTAISAPQAYNSSGAASYPAGAAPTGFQQGSPAGVSTFGGL